MAGAGNGVGVGTTFVPFFVIRKRKSHPMYNTLRIELTKIYITSSTLTIMREKGQKRGAVGLMNSAEVEVYLWLDQRAMHYRYPYDSTTAPEPHCAGIMCTMHCKTRVSGQ